jgi:two-component system, NarL family, nitrate/nitrite response regulator NarL
MPGVAVFIVADVALHRLGLARLLAAEAEVAVTGASPPGPDALARISQLEPEIVLLDVPEAARFREARAIGAMLPGPRVIAVGVPETEDEIVLCAEAGICGYVTPEASAEQLASTIASVARGELPCSARIAATLMRRVASLASAPPPAPPLYALTRRERQVVELVAQGLSNKEIAHCLAIEVTTVKTHVHHLLEKLQLRRRGELAALAHDTDGDGAARTP